MGSRRLISKAQVIKPASVVVKEYHMLQEMRRVLRGHRV
jgi:hypothetical protein